MARNFSYLKREFLNPITTTKSSYIFAQVENSIHGSQPGISNVITIADCHRFITLDFFLGTKQHRRQSLAKVNLLLEILTGFKKALEKESNLIDEYDAKKQD